MATDRMARVLTLYHDLLQGKSIRKPECMQLHSITSRTFERDLEDIRMFLYDSYLTMDLIFDRANNCYYMSGISNNDVNIPEIISMLRIILDSRSFTKKDMGEVVKTVFSMMKWHSLGYFMPQIKEEITSYNPVVNDASIMNRYMSFSKCIEDREKIILHYKKADNELAHLKVTPMEINFYGFFFFLCGYHEQDGKQKPYFFRFDRIAGYEPTQEHYNSETISDYKKLNLKEHLQFMFAGDYIKVEFLYWGDALQTILDTLSDAKICGEKGGKKIIEAQVFTRGFKMWMLGQGEFLEVVKPEWYRNEIVESIEKLQNIYKKNT